MKRVYSKHETIKNMCAELFCGVYKYLHIKVHLNIVLHDYIIGFLCAIKCEILYTRIPFSFFIRWTFD